MSDDQPTNVAMTPPGGDPIALTLRRGPVDDDGNQIWLAYGPAGQPVDTDSEVDGEVPDGCVVLLALVRRDDDGGVAFADMPDDDEPIPRFAVGAVTDNAGECRLYGDDPEWHVGLDDAALALLIDGSGQAQMRIAGVGLRAALTVLMSAAVDVARMGGLDGAGFARGIHANICAAVEAGHGQDAHVGQYL